MLLLVACTSDLPVKRPLTALITARFCTILVSFGFLGSLAPAILSGCDSAHMVPRPTI